MIKYIITLAILCLMLVPGCTSASRFNPFNKKADILIDYKEDTTEVIESKLKVNKIIKQDKSYRNIITVSTLLLAASIALLFIYPKVGVPGVIAATSSLLITILLSKFIFIVALIALGLFITLIVIFGYNIIVNFKALKEVILGVEEVKKYNEEEENNKIKDILMGSQSISTRKIVNRIKNG